MTKPRAESPPIRPAAWPNFVALLLLLLANTLTTSAQINQDIGDLYARTKQVNQFFRRFNAEEDKMGKRLYLGDSLYHDRAYRRSYFPALFELDYQLISPETREAFTQWVSQPEAPIYLDFHGGQWFAQVQARFTTASGRAETATLFLQLQEESIGSKWVLAGAFLPRYDELFFQNQEALPPYGLFLHPLSHELDFMNLDKVFEDPSKTELYASRDFLPDHLTLLLLELKNGQMRFQSVEGTEFHFFQIPGWYFRLSFFNRAGHNTGWLISNLMQLDEEQKKELIKFISHGSIPY